MKAQCRPTTSSQDSIPAMEAATRTAATATGTRMEHRIIKITCHHKPRHQRHRRKFTAHTRRPRSRNRLHLNNHLSQSQCQHQLHRYKRLPLRLRNLIITHTIYSIIKRSLLRQPRLAGNRPLLLVRFKIGQQRQLHRQLCIPKM